MSQSAIAKAISNFILTKFWPWFVKHIWPVIVKHIVSLVTKGLSNLSKSIGSSVSDRMQKRRNDAEKYATEATTAAESAATQMERDHHEAISKIWRQVAEQFRAENETLKNQIAELTARTQQSILEDLRLSDPVLENLESSPTLVIGGNTSKLPSLPYEPL